MSSREVKDYEAQAVELLPGVLELSQLAMQFAQVERGTADLNGEPESDTDHSVMLGFLAIALADYDPRLDKGKVAQYALVHDFPEVIAGDVRTLHPDKVDFAAKQLAEADAIATLDQRLSPVFPGFVALIKQYEAQNDLESTFVWTLDKSTPALTHLFNDCIAVLHEFDSAEQVRENSRRHTAQLESTYGADHPLVIALRRLISAQFADEFDKRKRAKGLSA
jgi:5'-deoxynucleotidase YfbR-like HD superfamily hydrolase